MRITTIGFGLVALLGCGTLVEGCGPTMTAATVSPSCSAACKAGTGTTGTPPAIAVVAPRAGSTVNSDITVPVSAVIGAGSASGISSVTFYAVDTCGQATTIDLGTVTAAPYTFQWVQPPPGIYTITAVADDAGMNLTSAPVEIYAGPDGIPPPCPTPPPSPAPSG